MGLLSSTCSNECNDIIHDIVFQPPSTPKDKFKELNNIQNNTRLLYASGRKGDIALYKCDPRSLSTKTKYIIFSHGNASDIYTMQNYMCYLRNRFGVCTIVYDYPGYGLSIGKASESNCYDALETVIDYVIGIFRVNPKNIILMGQSLGTGVVIDFISRYKTWSSPAILISPYKTIPRVASDTNLIDSCITNHRFDSINKAANINCPVKIFHGKRDRLIKITHAKDLYQKLPNKLYKPSWLNAGHGDILDVIEDRELYDVIFNL